MMRTLPRPTRTVAALALVALVALTAAGCADGGQEPAVAPTPTTATSPSELSLAVASYDLAVGEDQRFIGGLFTADREVVLGGEIAMRFFYLGEDGAASSADAVSETVTATFLPVPGKEPSEPLDQPTVVPPAEAAGVYEATVDLDQPGFYGVAAQVELADGDVQQATANFQVRAEHEIPDVGDPAPDAANRVVSGDFEPIAIDSRAQGEDAEVPDPELHTVRIPEALDDDSRPLVVVVSTPTYCVSQFCGPITETVAELADSYEDSADFVHLEVWQDFEDSVLNNAAAAWIQTEDGGSEPWVFFVDGDGTIQARWDNVLDETELVELLETA